MPETDIRDEVATGWYGFKEPVFFLAAVAIGAVLFVCMKVGIISEDIDLGLLDKNGTDDVDDEPDEWEADQTARKHLSDVADFGGDDMDNLEDPSDLD